MEVVSEIVNSLKTFGAEIVMPEPGMKGTSVLYKSQLFETVDMVLVLGGDGTLLSVARECAKYDIPILGLNFGHLGFLTEAENGESDFFNKIMSGEYDTETRMMLEIQVPNQGLEFYALNDAVVSVGSFSHIIDISVHRQGEKVNNYRADGLIVATPTGSTAYALSAGGPIVEPEAELMLVVPICAHSLASRSVVISPDQELGLKVSDPQRQDVLLTIDGQPGCRLTESDIVIVRKSKYTTKLIRMKNHSFFNILRKKLSEHE